VQSDTLIYRPAVSDDATAIMGLIQELANYERAGDEVSLSAKQLQLDGFGPSPRFSADVAEHENGLAGVALSYERYSTWKGKTLYLEDLIVTSDMRCNGIGSKLFDMVLERARVGGYARLEWQVLDWNEPAIRFYESIRWEQDANWINGRIRLI